MRKYSEFWQWGELGLPFILMVLLGIDFAHLKQKIYQAIDCLFHRNKFNYQKLLTEMSEELTTSLTLDQLDALLTQRLPAQLPAKWGAIALLDASQKQFVPTDDEKYPPLSIHHPLVAYLQRDQPVLRTKAIETLPDAAHNFLDTYHIDLCIPMMVASKLIGIYALGEKLSGAAFSKHDLQLLHTLGHQAAIAIRNVQLHEETQRRALEQETLREAMLALTMTLNRDEVINRILAQLQTVVPYDTATVQLLRDQHLEIVGGRGFPNLEELLGICFDINHDDNPNRVVVERCKSFIIEDVAKHYAEFHREPHAAADIHSWLGVPMLVGDQLVGMLALDKHDMGFYTPAHARLAEAFAAQAAVAIENSRLFQQEKEQRALNEQLRETALLVNSSLNLQKVLELILKQLARVVPCNGGTIQILESDATCVIASRDMPNSVEQSFPFDQYPFNARLAQGEGPIVIQDLHEDPQDFVVLKSIAHIHAIVGTPMWIRDKVIGIITVHSREANAYTEESANIIQVFAQHAATAIENARLHQQALDYTNQLERQVQERTTELQTQYARSNAILRSTTDGIVVTNEAGDILSTNPVAQAWLTQMFSPEDIEKLQEAIREVAVQVWTTSADQSPMKLLELTGIDLELRGAPIVQPQPQDTVHISPNSTISPSHSTQDTHTAVVVIHDVSHLRTMERIRRQFINDVSHEMRTPIATVKSYIHLMRMMPDKCQAYLDPLTQEIEHQAQLIQDIITISRLDAGRTEVNLQPTLWNELVHSAIMGHQLLAETRHVTLSYELSSNEIFTHVDQGYLTQALGHLLKNAITYTQPGGEVTVSTAKQEKAHRTWATVTVADTGVGIVEQEIPHIFERFYRGREPRAQQISGTGLGLPIVKEVVELHGGEVTIESEPGTGSAFTIWIPLATEDEGITSD